MNKISIPTLGEILKEEFIEPLGLSADSVAKRIGVSTSTIQEILNDQRSINAEISTQLGKLFGVSDRYLLKMQNDIDSRNVTK